MSNKGNNFEREICKKLSLWWSGGIEGEPRDDVFFRSSGSGARATTRGKKGLATANSYGDVMTIDPVGMPLTQLCLFEIKRGYTSIGRVSEKKIAVELSKMPLHLERIHLLEFITKVTRKIKKSGDTIDSLDIIDSNGSPLFWKWWDKIERDSIKYSIPHPVLIFQRDGKAPCIMIHKNLCSELEKWTNFMAEPFLYSNLDGLYIFRLNIFLSRVEPKHIINIQKRRPENG